MRKYSQVFLKNKDIAKRIVDRFLSLKPDKKICEIGPGKGILTEFLYRIFGEDLIVIDIDPLMIKEIKTKFPLLKTINLDFLKLNLSELGISYFIGNLPYHISTAIIEKLIKYENFKAGVFMLQKEVAKKLVSSYNDSEYGYLSAFVNIICKTTYLFDVRKENFYPVPKVDSAVVMIEKTNEISSDEFEKYIKFIGYAFRHKRKTLLNSINLSTGLEKEKIIKILEEKSINPNARAEEISPEKLFELSKVII
jgi:16S rRNA (adenine1518-N6/adenine1519-N6)-dimethyltransferase